MDKIQAPQFATIGKPLKIVLNVSENGRPTRDALVNYFISDWRGRVILTGRAEPQPAPTAVDEASDHQKGSYEINLNSSATAKFPFGPNLIKIFATGKEAFRPDIYTRTILAVKAST